MADGVDDGGEIARRGHDGLLDHDAFSSNRAEGIVIVFNQMEHDVAQKPVPTFWHHALAAWLAEDLPARFAVRIVLIDPAIAECWGDLMSRARQSGFAPSVVDGFFAATAAARALTLATRNTKDFAALRVPLFDPWTDVRTAA